MRRIAGFVATSVWFPDKFARAVPARVRWGLLCAVANASTLKHRHLLAVRVVPPAELIRRAVQVYAIVQRPQPQTATTSVSCVQAGQRFIVELMVQTAVVMPVTRCFAT